jgi:hypothetical protein
MKKFVVLAMVLAISGVAGAALSVNFVGVDRDLVAPGMQVLPSDTVTMQIISTNEFWNIALFMIATGGPSSVNIANATVVGNPANPLTGALGVVDYSGAMPDTTWILYADMAKPVIPAPAITNGVVVDGISFHCDGSGDVNIQLVDLSASIEYGTFTIQQIPEPMTLGLLSLGGLFLRRRLA